MHIPFLNRDDLKNETFTIISFQMIVGECLFIKL